MQRAHKSTVERWTVLQEWFLCFGTFLFGVNKQEAANLSEHFFASTDSEYLKDSPLK